MTRIAIPIWIIEMRGKRDNIEISNEAGERLNEVIDNLSDHRFIAIHELNRRINTADIVEIRPDVRYEYSNEDDDEYRELTPKERKLAQKKIAEIKKKMKIGNKI